MKLLLLPEAKYGEHLLPVAEKNFVFGIIGTSMITHEVVPPLPVILADDVS